ncbi:cytidine deaminase [Amaricoccus sp.]|uniref:cytidine deaminase n=1 Tax=Amaricoccus sp. TaxID=1872485 RepID=UPI001B3DAD11|nr:cytidine deaminase [Amaricoccus sp.]MBP7000847.1 cytidine deaminase [Amaricoccus sp.]
MSLHEVALAARENAHAPYSGFKVGAALRAADGRVFAGCNVENVAYPEGTCAEAGAIAAMCLAGAREIAEVVVVADSPEPTPPCGGCRQKLAEFASPDTPVTLADLAGARFHTTVGDLLPGAFTLNHMARVGA